MRVRWTDIDSQYLMAVRDGAGGLVGGARTEPSPTEAWQ